MGKHKVYKFGGAAVKDAAAIRNVADILIKEQHQSELLIVVSAMGHTTDALESLFYNRYQSLSESRFKAEWQQLHDFTMGVVKDLQIQKEGRATIEGLLERLKLNLDQVSTLGGTEAQAYDQIVSYGELISSHICNYYFQSRKIPIHYLDARQIIRTDYTWKEAQIDWRWTETTIRSRVAQQLKNNLLITQGFIGSTPDGQTTTLGREGSDFTGAIFANGLEAASLTTWKDVPGILNADPRRYATHYQYEQLSYTEAAEMTYYGANVIHPKTIRPLAVKGIPLIVRSFIEHQQTGTIISGRSQSTSHPALIVKKKQSLLRFAVKDFEYVGKAHLISLIHGIHEAGLSPNMLRVTAMSLSSVVDYDAERIACLKELLVKEFTCQEEHGFELLTIKNYTPEYLQAFVPRDKVIYEERSTQNYQALCKSE